LAKAEIAWRRKFFSHVAKAGVMNIAPAFVISFFSV